MLNASRLTLFALSLALGATHAGVIQDGRLPPQQAATAAQDPLAPKGAAAQAAWAAARAAMAAGDLKKAEAKFKEAAQADTSAAAPLVGLAEVALKRGDVKSAQTQLQAASKRDPKSVLVRLAQARLQVASGQLAPAQASYQALLKDQPDHREALFDLGDLLLRQRKAAEALPLFQRASQMQPVEMGAWVGLARAQASLGQRKEAMATLEQLAQKLPGQAMPLVAGAEMALALGEKAQAVSLAERAAKTDPKAQAPQLVLADALAANGQGAKAQEVLQSLLTLPGVNAAVVHTKIAILREAAKDLDGAMASYRTALRADPKFHPALNNLAWLASQRKQDLDEGLRAARKAVELVPNQLAYMDTLAVLLLARKEPKLALEAVASVLKAQPQNALLQLRKAQALQMLDQAPAARAALDLALKADPELKEARELQAQLGER
jgi:tetratricopeptide (TPR) repeat protein